MAEVNVHRLGGEGGELVAEAHFVYAAHGGPVGEVVVLLLHLVVQDIVQGICDKTVHIIVSPSNDLQEGTRTHARTQRRRERERER